MAAIATVSVAAGLVLLVAAWMLCSGRGLNGRNNLLPSIGVVSDIPNYRFAPAEISLYFIQD